MGSPSSLSITIKRKIKKNNLRYNLKTKKKKKQRKKLVHNSKENL